MKFTATHTDTFGGEANFSWVRRGEFEAPDDAPISLLVRRAKKSLDIRGVRHTTTNYGGEIVIRLAGYCQVVFVTEVGNA